MVSESAGQPAERNDVDQPSDRRVSDFKTLAASFSLNGGGLVPVKMGYVVVRSVERVVTRPDSTNCISGPGRGRCSR